jgi:ribosomal-protein-alanine N-acetyltransferase
MKKLLFSSKRFVIRPYRSKDYMAWRRAYLATFSKQNEFDLEKKSEKDLSKKEFEKFLKKNSGFEKEGIIYHFGVFEKRTGRLMGFVLLALVLRFNVQSARISYTVFNNYWKHGYGKEIVRATLLFAFKKLQLHRIEAEILPQNKASIALAKSLGFQSEGIRRKAVYLNKKWHDHLIYSLLEEDVGIKAKSPSVFNH